ncbi:MAG TPA: hypothetical protein DDW52_06670, partial [Planctomycetaceae bacterium]|nr:hypothetical protein [Planctomycetaceae bacterium]
MAPADQEPSNEKAPAINHDEQPAESDSQPATKHWLREPMLHFAIIGAGLFALYSFTSAEAEAPGADQIVVSEGKVEHLATLFARTWQRPPTREELQGLIDDYIKEEVAYREGVEIGLDRNDTIIRRRIRQKLDFVAKDFASQLEPTEEQLQSYLETHADDFRIDPRVSFRQVFFDPGRHDDDLSEVISDLVVKLQEEPTVDARQLGDRTLLEFRYEDVSEREVANILGVKFAASIVDLEAGRWQGPIESSFGLHAVLIEALEPGRLPNLQSARDSVRREW